MPWQSDRSRSSRPPPPHPTAHQRNSTLLRDLGLLPVNRVTAAKAGAKTPRRAKGQRVEKSTHVEDRQITLPDGSTSRVSLFAQGGTIGIGTLAANGDKHKYRWYNDYELPTHLGKQQISVRLHGNDDDARRKFNRTENVRPIPPGDPDFQRLYRRRNDAESINRAFDDTLFLRRAHSIGHQRQHLNLITYALTVNSLAIHRHTRQTADPPRQLAA